MFIEVFYQRAKMVRLSTKAARMSKAMERIGNIEACDEYENLADRLSQSLEVFPQERVSVVLTSDELMVAKRLE